MSLLRSSLGIAVILTAACSRDASRENVRVLGEAYAGPMKVAIRQEIAARSPEVAELTHGERVELVERRRRLIRVRTQSGALGWLDSRQLMTAGQIAELKQLALSHRDTLKIGEATVYEPLNLHNAPNRSSPSFAQIPEKGVVDVIGYRAAPRVPYVAPKLIEEVKPAPRKRGARKQRDQGAKDDGVASPPAPPAPEPPEDWIDLSKTAPDPETQSAPVRLDDWTLVRMKNEPDAGKVGWALSSMLVMAIPDDVAQYSEGHRIMAYWPLGEVSDEGVVKNHYLWATMSQKGQPFHFDGFRIFMYSTRRHRYEQAYREKNLRGWFPIDVVRPGRTKDYLAEFSIVSEDESGQKIRRTFAFLGYRVMKLDEQPWVPPKQEARRRAAPKQAPIEQPPWWKRLFGRSGAS